MEEEEEEEAVEDEVSNLNSFFNYIGECIDYK